MRCRHFLVVLVLVPSACAGPAAQPAAREPEPPAPTVPPPLVGAPDAGPGVAPAPPPEQKLELVLLPPAPTNPPVVVEIKFPIFEQLIPTAKAPAFKVRLKVENWPLAARGAGVEIALDKQAPRRVLDGDGVPLGSLSEELEPGEHVLTAWAVRDSGEIVRPPPGAARTPYTAVRFTIGESRGATAPEVPFFRFVSPTRTINGDRAADSVLLDFLPLSIGTIPLVPVRVKIQGDGAGAPPSSAELETRVWAPLGIRGLPNGDWKITLQHGTHQATQVITVNRDLAPALVP